MFFDNLTIAGIAVIACFAILPLLFGKEFLRVEEADSEPGPGAARENAAADPCEGRRDAELPCPEVAPASSSSV